MLFIGIGEWGLTIDEKWSEEKKEKPKDEDESLEIDQVDGWREEGVVWRNGYIY